MTGAVEHAVRHRDAGLDLVIAQGTEAAGDPAPAVAPPVADAPRVVALAEAVDLDALGEFAVDGATQRRFVIARDLDASEALLHERAEAIGRGELPPGHKLAF